VKRHYSALICSVVLLLVLLGGCAKKLEIAPETPSNDLKVEPSKIEYSFTGFDAELDEDNIVVNRQGMLEIIDLANNKLLKEIPVSKENGILGFDIYGDLIAWAETDPKSIKNDFRDSEKENLDIIIYNLKTDEKKHITKDKSAQSNPKVWKNYLIWQDNRDDKLKEYPGKWSLYLYDLNNGTEKKITSTLAAHATYNICDNKIVWEDERNSDVSNMIRGGDNIPDNNKDIYMYDIITGIESPIATGPYMESKPYVNGNYIVWEDRNNNTIFADIALYNIDSKEKRFITKDTVDQGTPCVFGDYVVWMDERRGTSTNDVIINGNQPNSDIIIYDLKKKEERILTGDEPQIFPKISSEWVAYTVSRQVNCEIQVVKYK